MSKTLLSILAVVGVIAMFVISTYNGFVKLEENTNQSWADVETQYQRRADLIPNLVSTVKGYASHEEKVFTSVTEARAKATQIQVNINDPESLAQFQAAQGELSSALTRLLAVAENYPELKANQNFLELQSQLEGTENRIAVARRDYNEVATAYNKEIRYFPGNFMAMLFGFERKNPFEADDGANNAPNVNFE